MKKRISNKEASRVFSKYLMEWKTDSTSNSSFVFYDLSFIEERINNLRSLFPPKTFHAIAIKANPLISMLKFISKLGVKLEAASFPEISLALAAGFNHKDIFFDSPAKTEEEIVFALSQNINLNADSFQELERINHFIRKFDYKGVIGLRINPQVGTGAIAMSSVAGNYSKFGVSIKKNRPKIIEAFRKYSWLNGIHLHVGSQGCSIYMLTEGVKIIYDLMQEINNEIKNVGRRIVSFDLGGGLPVTYQKENTAPTLKEYVTKLKKEAPQLFTNEIRIVTEFGRYIYANAGWTASRVEYVKEEDNINTAIIHLGADMFTRKCYLPDLWHHELSVVDEIGHIKKGFEKKYVIAGPLCFAGDKIADGIMLPEIKPGDYIITHDTGAYTLGMWSRYNSRQIPRVVGYENDGNEFCILKEKETVEDLVKFWS